MPLTRFARAQLAFLTTVMGISGLSKTNAIGLMAPNEIIKSLFLMKSPAMLPRLQMAYSTTSSDGEEDIRFIKIGTTPWVIRKLTWILFPLAKFVIHQAASYYIWNYQY